MAKRKAAFQKVDETAEHKEMTTDRKEDAEAHFNYDKTVIKWWLAHNDRPLIDIIPDLSEPNRLESFSINFKKVMERELSFGEEYQ